MRFRWGRTVLVTILFTLARLKPERSNRRPQEIQDTDQSQTATQISAPAPQASAAQTTHRFWIGPMTCGLRE